MGGASVQGLPTTATPGSPNYFYIIPAAGSGVSDGVAAVLATKLSTLSLANLQIQTLVNGNRLKVGVFGDNAVAGQDYSFPGGTTITFYLLQAISRNLTSAQAESIAADYLNPDSPTMTTGSFGGFSADQGLYTFTASGGAVTFVPTFSSTVQERWLDIYAVDGYTSSSMPSVSIGGSALTLGVQYLAAVDTSDHVAYVKLMEPLVPGSPGAGQLPGRADHHQLIDPAESGGRDADRRPPGHRQVARPTLRLPHPTAQAAPDSLLVRWRFMGSKPSRDWRYRCPGVTCRALRTKR